MKVAIFPDTSYMLYDLVKKNGHEPITVLSEYEKSRIDSETGINEGAPPYNMTRDNPIQGIKYATCEAPSGVRGRMSLFGPIIEEAEAAIIMMEAPYGFGCVGCARSNELTTFSLRKRNIPVLELDYPTSRDQTVEMVYKINTFLDNLDQDIIKGE